VNGKIVHALIPAAGQSVRFGGTMLKQYAHLLGLPVMTHSISALQGHPAVKSITVALAPDDGIFDELIRPEYPEVHTVTGGESRAETVLNGITYIIKRYPDCEWVLVHDAARPCLSSYDLDRFMELGLQSESGAILAVPVNDTLKLAGDDGFIKKTIDREFVWAAQTPQLFRAASLRANLQKALASGTPPTDEASAMELGGVHPLLVEGSSTNIKITGSEDLALAEFILQRQSVRK
jgi:2-C-methyl-D-erythritol 4-phosphate cytidylyltransferase